MLIVFFLGGGDARYILEAILYLILKVKTEVISVQNLLGRR